MKKELSTLTKIALLVIILILSLGVNLYHSSKQVFTDRTGFVQTNMTTGTTNCTACPYLQREMANGHAVLLDNADGYTCPYANKSNAANFRCTSCGHSAAKTSLKTNHKEIKLLLTDNDNIQDISR